MPRFQRGRLGTNRRPDQKARKLERGKKQTKAAKENTANQRKVGGKRHYSSNF